MGSCVTANLVKRVADGDTGEFVDVITAAQGETVPLTWDQIVFEDTEPVNDTGIIIQLLIKANREDDDADALVNVLNGSLTIETDPLVIGYNVDTDGPEWGVGVFYGELWFEGVVLPGFRSRPSEFQIQLTDPLKEDFS